MSERGVARATPLHRDFHSSRRDASFILDELALCEVTSPSSLSLSCFNKNSTRCSTCRCLFLDLCTSTERKGYLFYRALQRPRADTCPRDARRWCIKLASRAIYRVSDDNIRNSRIYVCKLGGNCACKIPLSSCE